jgi:hypothetical protein
MIAHAVQNVAPLRFGGMAYAMLKMEPFNVGYADFADTASLNLR